MNSTIHNEIVELLIKYPKGLRVGSIVRVVYNNHCDLFSTSENLKFRHLYQCIRFYLWQQSHKKNTPFERKKWGIYALQKGFAKQLQLDFEKAEKSEQMQMRKEETHMHHPDANVMMLNLFDTVEKDKEK